MARCSLGVLKDPGFQSSTTTPQMTLPTGQMTTHRTAGFAGTRNSYAESTTLNKKTDLKKKGNVYLWETDSLPKNLYSNKI